MRKAVTARAPGLPGLGHFWPGVMGSPTKDRFGTTADTASLVRWLECGK